MGTLKLGSARHLCNVKDRIQCNWKKKKIIIVKKNNLNLNKVFASYQHKASISPVLCLSHMESFHLWQLILPLYIISQHLIRTIYNMKYYKKINIINLCVSLLTCSISADTLNHIIPGTICSSHFWVSFLISFKRRNGKNYFTSMLVSMAFLRPVTQIGGGGKTTVVSGSIQSQRLLPGRDQILARQGDSSEIYLSQDVTAASPHALCMPLTWGLTVKADLSRTRTAKGALSLVSYISTISTGSDTGSDTYIYIYICVEARTCLLFIIFLCLSIPLIAESFNESYTW